MIFIRVISALPFLNDVQTSVEANKFGVSVPTLV